ncbi:DUF1972 domain-containing protein [Robertkochia sediminum]|uniref:DUF1972 domain-containing protein n=1 Tax=Robertkochia sediminum TaxID=2785326 RepID=UPI001F317E5D|nr:DUF1972 domain-containing protein [Robertkochia sediminum]MBL7473736.1 DUF1972 domain-containing protein [Robertkochia sediminum]
MSEKRIAIIGIQGIPAKYGGFETLTEHLTRNLSDRFSLRVFCSSVDYQEQLDVYNNAALSYIPLKANGIQSIPYDIIAFLRSFRTADTLLVLGVSGCIVLPLVKMISGKRIVTNIDGLEWKRAKWGNLARKFLKFSERLAVKYSDVVIADNKVIQDHVWEQYGKKSALIAYGGDHVKRQEVNAMALKEYPFLQAPYFFKVCRIEPENNIHIVLEAFKGLEDKPLVIVGNWNNSEYGKNLKVTYGTVSNITLLDPIYDQEKLDVLRSNAHAYIHGHSAGGTNPSLVEAMYLELPIIAFDVAYNRESTSNKAIYFKDAAELKELVDTISIADIRDVGVHMGSIANSQYRWVKIAEQYATLF